MLIEEARAALETGTTTSRALVEGCLARISDPAGEGARAFIRCYPEQARASADAMDLLRRVGRVPGPYAGIPVSIKDLFDVAGEVTTAGSVVLADAAPAAAHAPVVQRLLAAGLVIVGRTNMTEFAFSGVGLNPHYGTPLSPYDRDTGRIPRRQFGGRCRFGCRRHGVCRNWYGYGRVVPDTGGLLRHHWLQADRSPGADTGMFAAFAFS